MEVKPVGPERDRHIAELRGDEPWCIDCDDSPISACWKEHSVDFKPYSTDIAAAFELWEEMEKHSDVGVKYPGTDVYRQQAFGLDHISGECYRVYLGDMFYDGETLTDAISGAYVKWKVTNNG